MKSPSLVALMDLVAAQLVSGNSPSATREKQDGASPVHPSAPGMQKQDLGLDQLSALHPKEGVQRLIPPAACCSQQPRWQQELEWAPTQIPAVQAAQPLLALAGLGFQPLQGAVSKGIFPRAPFLPLELQAPSVAYNRNV